MNFVAVLFHWLPNEWTNKVMSACIYARSWSTFCDITLRDRFMPVVVTVRNASSTHKISAACLLCDVGMCCYGLNMKNTRDIDFVTRNLGTGACGVVIGANVLRMDFCLAHTLAEWSALLKQNIWMKCLHAFVINTHKCKATFLVCVSIHVSFHWWCKVFLQVWL